MTIRFEVDMNDRLFALVKKLADVVVDREDLILKALQKLERKISMLDFSRLESSLAKVSTEVGETRDNVAQLRVEIQALKDQLGSLNEAEIQAKLDSFTAALDQASTDLDTIQDHVTPTP